MFFKAACRSRSRTNSSSAKSKELALATTEADFEEYLPAPNPQDYKVVTRKAFDAHPNAPYCVNVCNTTVEHAISAPTARNLRHHSMAHSSSADSAAGRSRSRSTAVVTLAPTAVSTRSKSTEAGGGATKPRPVSSISTVNASSLSQVELQVRCARCLASLRNAVAANPSADLPALNLAKFILDNAALLPPQDRDALVHDAIITVHRLAEPRPDPTANCADAILLLANLVVSRRTHRASLDGIDNNSNYAEAFKLYLRAADAGSAAAAHNAALLLEHGRVALAGTGNRGCQRAAEELHVAAAAMDHPGSLLILYRKRMREAEDLFFGAPDEEEGETVEEGDDGRTVRSNKRASTIADEVDRRARAVSVALDAIAMLERGAQSATSLHPEPLYVLAKLIAGEERASANRRASSASSKRSTEFSIDLLPPTSKYFEADPARAKLLLDRAVRLGYEPARLFLGVVKQR
ncbi:hypothetical protein HK101_008400 [Irineochytrium annulatum]|nr:hypothetical protein HK101_008400 [Irineochytrium annulatum]